MLTANRSRSAADLNGIVAIKSGNVAFESSDGIPLLKRRSKWARGDRRFGGRSPGSTSERSERKDLRSITSKEMETKFCSAVRSGSKQLVELLGNFK